MRGKAQSYFGSLSHREILIAGAMAYWCEGTKNKAYRRSDQVSFINSDARLVVFFLRFLSAAEIGLDRVICRVYIHENADVAAAQRFWIRVTGLPEGQFREPTLKRHNPVTTRRNTGDGYHGCSRIDVRRSARLYREIEGWAAAVMSAEGTGVSPDAMCRCLRCSVESDK